MNIKLAIVDDHHLFVEGIESILNTIENFDVVISTSDGQDLLDKMHTQEVDIVLLDLEMKPMDGFEVFQHLKKSFPTVKVIILTMHSEPELIASLMKEGVNGYLLKETRKAEFERCINKVFLEGNYFNDTVSKAMLTSIQSKSTRQKPRLGNSIALTSRELEILELIAQEFTTQEIGEKLFLSPKTVEGHRKNLLGKFDVKNTAGLIIKAIEYGMIDVGNRRRL